MKYKIKISNFGYWKYNHHLYIIKFFCFVESKAQAANQLYKESKVIHAEYKESLIFFLDFVYTEKLELQEHYHDLNSFSVEV